MMNLTILTEKINAIFNAKKLFDLAREKKFIRRARQINPLKLFLSITNTLGCQSKANLADIHRNYQSISGMQINYKPFHNQLKKPQCSEFLKSCFENVMQQWVLQSLKLTSLSTGAEFPFLQIKLHDGCSFQVHDGLQKTYPGRFKKRFPAAIELHVTMDLLSVSIDYLSIGADTEPERPHAPKATSLNGMLLLTDAGYFDRKKIISIDQQDGYTITQSACSINPIVKAAYNFQGKIIKAAAGKKLNTLKLKNKNSTLDLTVRWPGYDFDFRVIAFWYKKKKRIGYLVTNLTVDRASVQLALIHKKYQPECCSMR